MNKWDNPNEFNGVFRYTYSLELRFDGISRIKAEPPEICSKDFETLTSWYDEIKKSPVYSYLKKVESTFFQTQLIKHKHGW